MACILAILWIGHLGSVPELAVTADCQVIEPAAIAGALECVAAHYPEGQAPLGTSIAATIRAVPVGEGCLVFDSSGTVAADTTTEAVLTPRGDCGFSTKALFAEHGKFSAILISDNTDQPVSPPGLGDVQVKIPVVMISQEMGELLRTSLDQGSTVIVNITIRRQQAQDAVPDFDSVHLLTGVVGGLVNQMWSVYNTLAFATAQSKNMTQNFTVVLPQLSLNNEKGPFVPFSYFYDVEHLRAHAASSGLRIVETLPPSLLPHCSAQLGRQLPQWDTLRDWAENARVICLNGFYAFGYLGPPPFAVDCPLCAIRDRRLFDDQMKWLTPSARYRDATSLAMLTLAHRFAEEEEEAGGTGINNGAPQSASAAASPAAVAPTFASLHLRVEADFADACENIWPATDHPTRCWVGEEEVALLLQQKLASGMAGQRGGGQGEGEGEEEGRLHRPLLFVASGDVDVRKLRALCERVTPGAASRGSFRCFSKADLGLSRLLTEVPSPDFADVATIGSNPADILLPTAIAIAPSSYLVSLPELSASGGGSIFESRESLAFLDFQLALQATNGFFGNAWSSFSVELLARHQQRQQGGSGGRETCLGDTEADGCKGTDQAPLGFYNPWIERGGRGEWGVVAAPPV
jgi:hypothetical protein